MGIISNRVAVTATIGTATSAMALNFLLVVLPIWVGSWVKHLSIPQRMLSVLVFRTFVILAEAGTTWHRAIAEVPVLVFANRRGTIRQSVKRSEPPVALFS